MAIDIYEDIKFQRRMWAVQRFGWIIIAAAIVAGLSGLFGSGPVSRASAEATGLRIEYERFVRLQQPTMLRCFLSGTEPETQIALRRDYLDFVRIEAITPTPARTEASGEWLVYRFTSPAPIFVEFNLIPENFGRLNGTMRAGKGQSIGFHQFIYP
jgi:hypothetical protein